jgi:hypothetical protein
MLNYSQNSLKVPILGTLIYNSDKIKDERVAINGNS